MLFSVSRMVNPAHMTSPLWYLSVGGWAGRDTERRAMTYGSLRRKHTNIHSQSCRNGWSLTCSIIPLTHCCKASSLRPTRWSPGGFPLPDWLKLENQKHCGGLMGWPHDRGSHHRPPSESAHTSWLGTERHWWWGCVKQHRLCHCLFLLFGHSHLCCSKISINMLNMHMLLCVRHFTDRLLDHTYEWPVILLLLLPMLFGTHTQIQGTIQGPVYIRQT